MNVCSVLFEYIACTIRTILQRTLPLVFYHEYIHFIIIHVHAPDAFDAGEERADDHQRDLRFCSIEQMASHHRHVILYYACTSAGVCGELCEMQIQRNTAPHGDSAGNHLGGEYIYVCVILLAFINGILQRHPFVILF